MRDLHRPDLLLDLNQCSRACGLTWVAHERCACPARLKFIRFTPPHVPSISHVVPEALLCPDSQTVAGVPLASLTEDMNPKELEKQLYHPASGLHTSLDTLYNLLGALPHEADMPQHQQHLLQSSGSSWPESSTPDRWADGLRSCSALFVLFVCLVKAAAARGFHRCAAA